MYPYLIENSTHRDMYNQIMNMYSYIDDVCGYEAHRAHWLLYNNHMNIKSSQISSNSYVCSTVYYEQQIKYQSSALRSVRGTPGDNPPVTDGFPLHIVQRAINAESVSMSSWLNIRSRTSRTIAQMICDASKEVRLSFFINFLNFTLVIDMFQFGPFIINRCRTFMSTVF